jgi:hypothetical protein
VPGNPPAATLILGSAEAYARMSSAIPMGLGRAWTCPSSVRTEARVGSLNLSGREKHPIFPKTFLRLRTKFQTANFPMTLAKWFVENSLVDSKGLGFYDHHCEFLGVLNRINLPPPILCFQWVRFLPKTFPKNSSELSQLSIEWRRRGILMVCEARRQRLVVRACCVSSERKNQTGRHTREGCEREERGGEAPRRLILPELQ